ncbi:MAG: SIS domain-containing protein, partial [Kineosporiaceae bacterium]
MDAEGFLADLEAKPQSLRSLAEAVDGGLLAQAGPFLDRRFRRYRLIGMGSSSYAAHVAAARMRSLGLDAAAELASSRDGYPMDPDTLVVAISASGATAEVLDALDRLDGHFPVLALTNQAGSPLSGRAGAVLPLTAGTQRGPIACRSFQHTGLLLHGLSIVWSGGLPRMAARDVAVLAGRVADACDHLLSRREEWLPAASTLLDGPQEVQVLAPAERISSAQQSALT